MVSRILIAGLLVSAILASATASRPSRRCRGSATYKVFFANFLTAGNFPGIPSQGLVYSPLVGISHSNRQSFLTVRGFASKAIEDIAETGDNSRLVSIATRMMNQGRGVMSVVNAGGPTMPGNFTSFSLKVNCEHPFISVVGMIAPSPDWIVQINNRNLIHERTGHFKKVDWGFLIAYDAGTDNGRDFTDPGDRSLDMPTSPKVNIAPLVEDSTDRFQGRNVGKFIIKRIK